jgi:hypothetical protein
LFREDRESGRAEVVKALRRAGAHIDKTAALLGILRRQLYRLLWREALWEEVDRIRADAKKREEPKVGLVAAARAALLSRHGVQTERPRAARPAGSGEGGGEDPASTAARHDDGSGGGVRVRAHVAQAVVSRAARGGTGDRR